MKQHQAITGHGIRFESSQRDYKKDKSRCCNDPHYTWSCSLAETMHLSHISHTPRWGLPAALQRTAPNLYNSAYMQPWGEIAGYLLYTLKEKACKTGPNAYHRDHAHDCNAKESAETEAETTSKKQEGAEGGLDTAACTILWGYALRYTLL